LLPKQCRFAQPSCRKTAVLPGHSITSVLADEFGVAFILGFVASGLDANQKSDLAGGGGFVPNGMPSLRFEANPCFNAQDHADAHDLETYSRDL